MVKTDRRRYDLSIYHNCAKFSKIYVCSIAETLEQIIHNIQVGSKGQLCDIACLGPKNKDSIMKWNLKRLPNAASTCLHYMVGGKAKEIPDCDAICAWDGSLTYRQLDLLSSSFAALLIRNGVQIGDYIPFAFEKSLWTVVAALAILKAGGAFVPLDPSHPKFRLEEILKCTSAKVVVTSKSLRHILDGLDKHVVVLSAETCSSNTTLDVALPCVRPSNPVFVLFTSGSTGQPKGMVHEHGAICTYLITHGELMGYLNARVLQFSAYTFDIAVLDIFTTLILGGCVCIPSEEDRINNITQVINDMKVDFALLTPSFASLINPADVPTLRSLCTAGESLNQEIIDLWASKVLLMNAYGPAEVGICTLKIVDAQTCPETIGYPLLNCSCWLVHPEDHHRLVPVGAVGELVVASPSLARGYLNNELKTKSSFVTGLAWAESMNSGNCRFYKTGDLLRHNTRTLDGSFDFIRRKDTQVKLHGQRIETGEIEHRLAELPDIAVSVVLLPKHGCFTGELVAVLQMSSSKSPRFSNTPLSLDIHYVLDQDKIRKFLSKHLPKYMVPMAFLVIASVPFVQSCKIDRKAIDGWISRMKTRPFSASYALQTNQNICALEPHELTAHALSKRVANLVALKDEARGLMLHGHDFNILDAGVDSVQMVKLFMFLKSCGVQLPVDKLWNSDIRIRDLAYLMDRPEDSKLNDINSNDYDALQEYQSCKAELLNSINSGISTQKDTPVWNVFVTGASGYVGLRILQNIMERSIYQVFVLARCQNPSEGMARIINAALRQGWWLETYKARLHVWPGDLSKPNFGLEKESMRMLNGSNPADQSVHAIIHNAARVHYNLDYNSLKTANVTPTMTLLKILASARDISTFLYVSGGTNPTLEKETIHEHAERANRTNGYGQSKYVSESLVRSCMEHCAYEAKNMHIIKPGYIISSAGEDAPQTTDFLWRLLAGCLEIKAYNQDEEQHWLYISDVEQVAGRIGDCFQSPRQSKSTQQVLNGLRYCDLWKSMREDFGYELIPLPYDEWRQRLESAIITRGDSHLLFPFAHKLKTNAFLIGSKRAPNEESSHVIKAVKWNVKRLIELGFLSAPLLSC